MVGAFLTMGSSHDGEGIGCWNNRIPWGKRW
jgi:hypothetical protein